MYKIVKLTENDVPVYVVINNITKREVARYNTYQEAVLDITAR
jgi:hypothetical protein